MSFYEIVGYFAVCAILGSLIGQLIRIIVDRFSKPKTPIMRIKVTYSWASRPFAYNCRANGTPYRNAYTND